MDITEIQLKFNDWSRNRLAGKRKFATTRTTRHGDIGDIFVVDGVRYELTEIIRLRLSCVSTHYFQAEGCDDPAEFIEVWTKIHPRSGWEPCRAVWLHMFRVAEEKKQ